MPPAAAQCANPLFLKWLEELRDEAREKGTKVASVYNKACRAVAACPVPYARPRELAVLQGIGPKTVQILDKKLRAHCEATGEPYPEDPPPPPPKRPVKSKSKASAAPDADGEDADGEDEAPPPKKRRNTKPRPYIPAPRSGPSGILIGMIVAAADEPDDALTTYLTRGEIVRHAQPFCEASYDHSERGTWVTAWNGMKTLVNKGYVCVQGMPHRYCLSEAGYDVAAVLRNMTDEYKNQPPIVPFCRRAEGDGPFRPDVGQPGPGPSTLANAAARAAPAEVVPRRQARVSGSRFSFWYIGKRVERLDGAKQRLDPEEFVTLRRVEFPESLKDHAFVQQLRLIDDAPTLYSSGMVTLFAYIVEDEAPPTCSKFEDVDTLVSTRTPAQPPPPSTSTLQPQPQPATALTRTGSSRPRLSVQLPRPGEHRETPDFDPSEAIVFAEGTYDIVLILDTREVESRNSRDRIREKLERKGIQVETRALRLGDMCWVARRKDAYGAEEDECVLDFVVERKRLDDLCTSIRDGRYNEQCFRLGESGIGNVFYVVEDWQRAEYMQFHKQQIQTAKSQIQVINNFFLKETKNLNDTIDYLTVMTSVIKGQSRDLLVIPSRYLSRTNYTALQKKLRDKYPDKVFLTSYEAYQALNKKSSLRTVKEYLARMLLCIKGMSPERVSAMIDVWETPHELWVAMKERNARGVVREGRKSRGPEHMFADMVPGFGRRKIGDAQSKTLWAVLWGNAAKGQAAANSAGTSAGTEKTLATEPLVDEPARLESPSPEPVRKRPSPKRKRRRTPTLVQQELWEEAPVIVGSSSDDEPEVIVVD